MTEDEKAEFALLIVTPVRDLLDRTMALLERLTDRVEVLELERLHQRPPAATS